MAIFLVELPATVSGHPLVNETTAYLTEADSAAAARELCASQHDSDSNWINTGITATDVSTLSAGNMLGWRYVVTVRDAGSGGDSGLVAQVEHIGLSGDADPDAMAADLVTALNLHPLIAGAAFSTPTLTVTQTTDNLGDKAVSLDVYPPGAKERMPAMVGAIVDEGSVGAATTVVLTVPTAIPAVFKAIK